MGVVIPELRRMNVWALYNFVLGNYRIRRALGTILLAKRKILEDTKDAMTFDQYLREVKEIPNVFFVGLTTKILRLNVIFVF